MQYPVLVAGALLLAACTAGTPPGDTTPADDDTTPADDDTMPADDDTTPADDDTSGGDPPPDYRSAGPLPVVESTGSHTTAAGCVLPYEWWEAGGFYYDALSAAGAISEP